MVYGGETGQTTRYLAFCPQCGKEISDDAAFCPECGTAFGDRVPVPTEPGGAADSRANAGAAVVLSAIFPGLGQTYIGEKKRGTAFIIIGLILLATFLIEIGVILYPIFLIVNIIGVYRSAKRTNGANGPRNASSS